VVESTKLLKRPAAKPAGFDDGQYSSRTKLGNLPPLPTSIRGKSSNPNGNETHREARLVAAE
jgi:hypothetical protein